MHFLYLNLEFSNGMPSVHFISSDFHMDQTYLEEMQLVMIKLTRETETSGSERENERSSAVSWTTYRLPKFSLTRKRLPRKEDPPLKKVQKNDGYELATKCDKEHAEKKSIVWLWLLNTPRKLKFRKKMQNSRNTRCSGRIAARTMRKKAASSYKTRVERKEKEPDLMICSQWVRFLPLRVCSLASGSEARFADGFGGEVFRC